MQVFKQHFQPATNLKESDEQMTTEEIFDKFVELSYDEALTLPMIQELMTSNGFVYDYVLDGFKWLLKLVRQQEPG